jgi:hypothetical protein
MMNNLGKSLVLVNLALSVLGLGWAVAVFLSPVDWGRSEARKTWSNERQPARIDERLALLKHVRTQVKPAVERVNQAQARLTAAETFFGYNHLYYVAELNRLQSGKGEVKARAILIGPDGGPLLTAGQPYGLPRMDDKATVPGIEKSYEAYQADYEARMARINALIRDMLDEKTGKGWLAKQERITRQLTGEREGDKLITPGLYDLQEEEAQIQKRLREEMAALQPQWVRELYNAQLLRTRRLGLEKRLRELGVSPESIVP